MSWQMSIADLNELARLLYLWRDTHPDDGDMQDDADDIARLISEEIMERQGQ